MRKVVLGAVTMLASYIGWWIGYRFGLMTAFFLSMIGTGVGMYVGRRYIPF